MSAPKPRLADWQLNTLADSIKSYYLRDTPPPDEVDIPLVNISSLDKKGSLFRATVITFMRLGKKGKEHKVNIKFRAHNFKLIPSTINYI